MNKKYIYVAGPLFTETDLNFNEQLSSFLREKLDAAKGEVFVPQEFNINKEQITADARLTNEKTIAEHDLDCIRKSSVIVVNLDNLDPGTFTELGYFFKKLDEEPTTLIFGIYTDGRKQLNKFVYGMFLIHQNAFLAANIAELKETIVKYVK